MANPEPNNQNQAQNTETTTSTSTFETVNGSHDFVIKRYLFWRSILPPGGYISSDTFTVGGCDWAIYFYPYSDDPRVYFDFVSVFIVLVSEAYNVRALLEITLVAQTAENDYVVHSHFDRDAFPYTFQHKDCKCGYNCFIRRDVLENSSYLKNDCLQLKCRIGVVRSRMESPEQYKIAEQFMDLLRSGIGSDIVFNVGDKRFKAHKQVLAARSPVFKAMFFGLINPNIDSVTIEDVEPSVFKAMLLYIYSDRVPDLSEITGSHSSSTAAFMMQHLLAASDRYSLDRLKIICESNLCDEITVETVLTTLMLAEQHNCEQLKSVCLNFAATHLNEIVHLDAYKNLEHSLPSELLQIVAKKRRDSEGAEH